MAIVAITGRPNVGKSTLFNRLIGGRKAIVDDISGVTRDRNYGNSDWNGKGFTVIDTGGFVANSDDVFEKAIREQVVIAMEEADVVIFMVDVSTGITDLDQQMADVLRKSGKEIILVVNKVDNTERLYESNDFYSLGFKELYPVASISGSGTGELLDKVVQMLPEDMEDEHGDLPRFAIIGQPNVGKSSLLNALIGEERNIVTEIPGTTRDSIHTHYNLYNKDFILIDTAGVRKKAKVHENIEFYSVIRAIKAVEDADVCLLMIDATLDIEAQDLQLIRLVERRKKGLMIVVNKWDLIEKETNTAKVYEKNLKERIAPFSDVPVIFISALEKQRIHKVIEEALKVYENRLIKISTSKLNEMLQKAIEKQQPPSKRGKFIKIKYATQLPTHAPSFVFFCNHPNDVKEAYRNYLENQLRSQFVLTGVPISIYFRKK